jgi:hypothetical protein
MLMASRVFSDKRQYKKGTFISVIFLNANRFDKSNRKYLNKYINIDWILILIWISKHELYK